MDSIQDIGAAIGLGSADLKMVVINIIQLALGYAALVTVFMIIVGGLRWMTSAGNEERLDQAKRTISSAVIGLILIILSWAIVLFAVQTTANVTHA